MIVRLFLAVVLAVTLSPARARAQADPTLEDLVTRARAHQRATDEMLRRYSWVQDESFEMRKPDGTVVRRERRKVRVYPVKDGVIVDLLEVDGREPTKKELAENEKRNRRTEERVAKREREARGGEEEDAPGDDAGSALLELLGRTRYEIAGRETSEGRELIGIAFEPDPKAEGEGMERKLLRHSRGTVWLDAETAQPVRGTAGAADKFRVAGVVGVKDFSLVAEQVRVADEIWLPSRFELEGAMTLLGAKRTFRTSVTFSGYQRASVSVETEGGATAAESPAAPPAGAP